ncbi:MAG: HAMP domain-containing histidine kinase [Candidatus Obscuribacterales bacterium]|nr:HAMP domain-containing histidine kinase [Candidatus Obscuribacterales bacterium]
MKLRYQAAILLGIPLLCQLAFAQILVSNLQQLDEAAIEEARAKKAIASCQEVRSCVARYNMLIAVERLDGVANSKAKLERLKKIADFNLGELRDATRGDKDSAAKVEDYASTVGYLQKLFVDIMGAYEQEEEKPAFARFLSEGEALEDLATTLSRSVEIEDGLISKYAPLQEKFQPLALAERRKLRDSVIVFAITDAVVVVLLFAYFGRITLRRMHTLMTNISEFSKGRTELEPVGGADELTELDQEFRTMAIARTEADQKQRSMYAMISHDLRSPLTSAGLSLSYVEQVSEGVLPEKAQIKLRKVNAEIDRLMRLASSFLDLEQLDAGSLKLNREIVDLNDLVQAALDAVSALAQAKQISLITAIEAPVTVNVDRDRIVQVLVNLLSNAVKFSPNGSEVKIDCRPINDGHVISIEDAGKGIASEDLAKLFQRFSQLDGTTSGGSGLGLFICKLLVELHGGAIGADSAADGSVFWFSLPK